MAYIQLIDPEAASGDLVAPYKAIAAAYGKASDDSGGKYAKNASVPMVYRVCSLVPAYVAFGAVQATGWDYMDKAAPVPGVLLNFAVAMYSSCFYCTESIAGVLPLLYPNPEVAQVIVEDPETAPIPVLHKHMYRWAKRFALDSWTMTYHDIDELRAAGLADSDIANWAGRASAQTWFHMCSDAGGADLDGGRDTGYVLGRDREHYARATLDTGPARGRKVRDSSTLNDGGIAWIGTNGADANYQEAAGWAKRRYGFAPNLLLAGSLRTENAGRLRCAFELLERPQSSALSPRQHAMIRALTASINRCAYSIPTTQAFLDRVCDESGLYDRITGDHTTADWSDTDRAVLDFAAKVTRHAYKVVPRDAQIFRDTGLGEAAYVDVFCTVALQASLDRMANSLGVEPDERPVLVRAD